MERYSACMQHSADSVKRFVRLQYQTFEWWRKLIILLLSVFCMLAGIASRSPVLTVFCLFAGALLITNIDRREQSVAEEVIRAVQGQYPRLEYAFSDTGFTDGEDRPTVPYRGLIRLIADEDYLYLFSSRASGYMIDKGTVEGPEGADGLMRLIAEQSGLVWSGPVTLLSFRLRDLKTLRRKRSGR